MEWHDITHSLTQITVSLNLLNRRRVYLRRNTQINPLKVKLNHGFGIEETVERSENCTTNEYDGISRTPPLIFYIKRWHSHLPLGKPIQRVKYEGVICSIASDNDLVADLSP